jgi:F-type H+-transporting ATPase subunit delta
VATTDQTISGVEGRYANALFQLATEQKSVDKTGDELEAFRGAIESSPELKRLVRSPLYSAADQIEAIDAISGRLAIDGLTLNFLKLVASKRRLAAISGIIATYGTLLATARGEVQAEVTSAEKLTDKRVKEIRAALKASIGREVQLATKVDGSLLGGLIVKVGSRMLDNSLKTKLQNLKIAMKGST